MRESHRIRQLPREDQPALLVVGCGGQGGSLGGITRDGASLGA